MSVKTDYHLPRVCTHYKRPAMQTNANTKQTPKRRSSSPQTNGRRKLQPKQLHSDFSTSTSSPLLSEQQCATNRVYLNYKIGSRYLATSIPTSTIQSNLSNSTCYVTTRKSGQQYAHTIKPLLRSDGTPCYVSIHHGKIVVKIAKTIVHRSDYINTTNLKTEFQDAINALLGYLYIDDQQIQSALYRSIYEFKQAYEHHIPGTPLYSIFHKK